MKNLPLRCSGDIPEHFTKLSSQKYREGKGSLDRNKTGNERRAQEKFLLESNFLIDEFLLSGMVLFNDPLSKYINKVADVVLKNHKDLNGKIEIYTIKSSEVNAFATDNGIVLVTLGLLAQLENEAQLGFVLCHEVIHYLKKHSMNLYVEEQKIVKGQGEYRRTSLEERLLARSHYSKEGELDADKEGFELYAKSNYDIEVINGAFDVLQYSYLPFDEIEFDKSFFETEYLKYPDEYELEELKEISGDDDYDDSKSSHPNIRKRRKAMEKELENHSNDGRVKYLVSKDQFLKMRDLARFEMSRLYLIRRNYAKSIYNSYLLLQKYPDNKYLETSIAQCMYGIVKYRNNGMMGRVHPSYKNIEGSSQQLFYFLKKNKAKELNTLALSHAWGLKKKYPDDKLITNITTKIFKELVFEHNAKPEDYFSKSKEEMIKESEEKKEDNEELSKYDKIKRKKEVKEVKGDEHFMKYAFVDMLNDDEFKDQFEELIEEYDELKQKKDDEYNRGSELRRKRRKNKRIVKNKGIALGIDKVVVVDPFYKKIFQGNKEEVRYLASEQSQRNYIERLKRISNKVDIGLVVMDSKGLKADDVDIFNDHAVITEWVDEWLLHEDDNMRVSLKDNKEIKGLIERYDTKYFGWTGVLSIKQTKGASAIGYLILSALTIYGLPYGIYQAVVPDYDTYYYMVLFDIEEGKVKLAQKKYMSSRDRDDILNVNIYDALHQMKSKRKAKK